MSSHTAPLRISLYSGTIQRVLLRSFIVSAAIETSVWALPCGGVLSESGNVVALFDGLQPCSTVGEVPEMPLLSEFPPLRHPIEPLPIRESTPRVLVDLDFDRQGEVEYSIIMPAFNAATSMVHSLPRIFANTIGNWELLILLDQTHDNSLTVVLDVIQSGASSSLSTRPLRVRVIESATPRWEAASENLLMQTACRSARWFVSVQPDQMIHEPRWNERLKEPAEHFHDVLAVSAFCAHSWADTYHAVNVPSMSIGVCLADRPSVDDIPAQRELYRRTFFVRDTVSRGPMLLRAAWTRQLGFFDEVTTIQEDSDHDLFCRAKSLLGRGTNASSVVTGYYNIDYSTHLRLAGSQILAKSKLGHLLGNAEVAAQVEIQSATFMALRRARGAKFQNCLFSVREANGIRFANGSRSLNRTAPPARSENRFLGESLAPLEVEHEGGEWSAACCAGTGVIRKVNHICCHSDLATTLQTRPGTAARGSERLEVFLTYDDGTHSGYLAHLHKSVRKHGPGWRVVNFKRTAIERDVAQRHFKILSERRGGGYWMWKPYIIKTSLQLLDEGDLVFYLDSKYYFWEPFAALYEGIEDHNGIAVWRNKPNEDFNHIFRHYCKMDVLVGNDMAEAAAEDDFYDCWGGAMVVQKRESTMGIIGHWLNLSLSYEQITDVASSLPNSQGFVEHRHDQALLTITLHKHGISLWDSTTGGGAPIGKRFMQNWRRPYVDCVIGKTASGKKKFMCPGDPPPETAPRGAAVYAPFSAVAREGAESRLLPILAPTAHPTKD